MILLKERKLQRGQYKSEIKKGGFINENN